MKSKCFVALKMPDEIILEIQRIQNQLPKFVGKKTEEENLHLTLKFLGWIDESKLKIVKEKLEEIEFNLYRTNLDYLGFFDNQKYGVVWLHLPNCEGLQKKVDENLKDLFEKEKRFMSHLTISRVKRIDDKKEFLENLREITINKIPFNVDKFYLMDSKTYKGMPVYSILSEYKLS